MLFSIPQNGELTLRKFGDSKLLITRFIQDEILIEGKKIKTTGALLTGGRSEAVPGERIAQHQSERAPNAEDNYNTLSPN